MAITSLGSNPYNTARNMAQNAKAQTPKTPKTQGGESDCIGPAVKQIEQIAGTAIPIISGAAHIAGALLHTTA